MPDAFVAGPTAVQAEADGHDTLVRLLWIPGGAGVVRVQLVPSHRTANG